MAISKTFNVDCLEYMKSLPDKHFELTVADAPYGDGSSQIVNVERERAGRRSTTASEGGSTGTNRPLRFHGGDRWNRYLPNYKGGWHGKEKYHLGQLSEQEERGRQSTGKKS